MDREQLTIDIEMVASMGLDVDDYLQLNDDWRIVDKGSRIPNKTYSDQPYLVKTDDGAWLCVMTTGTGREGEGGQHVISCRSTDKGKSWSQVIEVEPPSEREASYAVLLKTAYGRIYCFYNYNADNVRKIIADKKAYPDGYCRRVDSLGSFVFKYSDDHGRSWSENRYTINVRETEIDRLNPYQGKIKFFWNVGKAFSYNDKAYVPIHKVGSFGKGFFTKSEGFLLQSNNLLTEKDPEKITWQTLPDGERGLRTPEGGGPISEEHSFSVMSDGSFFVVYRSIDGHPVCSYSRDEGRSWTEPQYMTYTPGGKKIKNPRAANFAWKCSNGKYLYWFHNHGGRDYEDRNPVWVLCGEERDGPEGPVIEWSQPEIMLYGDDPFIRYSYPDMIEQDDRIYITETNKYMARVHKIDPKFLKKIFNFSNTQSVADEGLLVDITRTGKNPAKIEIHSLPKFLLRNLDAFDYSVMNTRNGITLDFCVNLTSLRPGQNLLDNRTSCGRGFCITVGEQENIRLTMNDGLSESCWSSEPGVLRQDHLHHISVIIDSGPKIITALVDGKFCDGGDDRQFGWGRFSSELRHINGSEELVVGKDVDGCITTLRIYNRALMSTEAVGNYRATLKNT